MIGSDREYHNESEQDHEDVASLYEILEQQIVPLYYQREADGLPRRWVRHMKEAITSLTPRFSASRMVKDYVEQGYLPVGDRKPLVVST